MAEELSDPREVAWHPRMRKEVIGHGLISAKFESSLATNTLHHAWMMCGPSGVGKATLAYSWASRMLEQGDSGNTTRAWIENRAHPDLIVLERSFSETKPRRLRSEITVDDARKFIDHFSKTASRDWRIGIVDSIDDLNTEAANALLKLVEEPPSNSLILLVCHQQGRVLPTLRSRCVSVHFAPLATEQTVRVINNLPLTFETSLQNVQMAAELSGGRPGWALSLMNAQGAKTFALFKDLNKYDTAARAQIANSFQTSKTASEDYRIFMDLFLAWLADQAKKCAGSSGGQALASAFVRVSEKMRLAEAYNLDRKTALLDHMYNLEEALKAA
jgi:DNA polymerase III subunit delta'